MAEPAVDEEASQSLPAEFEFEFQQLTATEKAAIVMFLLEEAGAAAVMQTLSPPQVTSVSRAMIKVSDVPQPIVVAVVRTTNCELDDSRCIEGLAVRIR